MKKPLPTGVSFTWKSTDKEDDDCLVTKAGYEVQQFDQRARGGNVFHVHEQEVTRMPGEHQKSGKPASEI